MKDETQKILGEFAFDSLDKDKDWDAFAAFFEKFYKKYGDHYKKYAEHNTNYVQRAFSALLTTEARNWFCEIFSEEEKPEQETDVFYKVGDRFKHCRGTYKLSSFGNNMVALVKIERYGGAEVGRIFVASNYDYSVIDLEHITEEEFSRLADNYQYTFTLIKEEE